MKDGGSGIGHRAMRWLKSRWVVAAALLAVIWLVPPALSEDYAFGLLYQMFFTAVTVTGAGFFWLLDQETMRLPGRPSTVLASILAVYLVSVGLLVGAGAVLPNFQPPATSAGPADAVGRGEQLFWASSPGCFLCHSIDGGGGSRAPALTNVGSQAGDRVPGLTAEEYLTEKIKAGMTYEYTVPEYSPIMPPFGESLTAEQISDLVAYLMGPR